MKINQIKFNGLSMITANFMKIGKTIVEQSYAQMWKKKMKKDKKKNPFPI